MPIHEDDIAELTVLLSPERLGPLTSLTGNVKAAIELHQETLRLGAALMSVTATIEIALRNAICENLGDHFGTAGWLLTPPAPFRWRESEEKKIAGALDSARRAEYSKLSQTEKHGLDSLAFPNGRPAHLSHLKRAKGRREEIHVSDGKIIAELTFYIWKRLCGPDYEHTLWKPTLKKTFPHKKVRRAEVADHLETLYQSRNRLAHHEPVLHKRFHETMNAIKFIVEHLQADPPSSETPRARLVAEDIEALRIRAEVLHARLDSFRT
ncbi:MAG: hypothetical protein EOP19_00330 [Hyphomicrobiales bacterium]|nr:MAG: hypothetical protein EOP19_00330 [Hyphomicrobiales bacterium]